MEVALQKGNYKRGTESGTAECERKCTDLIKKFVIFGNNLSVSFSDYEIESPCLLCKLVFNSALPKTICVRLCKILDTGSGMDPRMQW